MRKIALLLAVAMLLSMPALAVEPATVLVEETAVTEDLVFADEMPVHEDETMEIPPDMDDLDSMPAGALDAIPDSMEEGPAPISTDNLVVTVPAILPAMLYNDGTVQTATDAKITNKGTLPVTVTGIQAEVMSPWYLVDGSYDFNNSKVNTKALYLTVQGESVLTDGTVPTGSGWDIPADSAISFDYGVKVPAQEAGFTCSLARMAFTVEGPDTPEVSAEWEYTISGDTITLTKYIGSGPDIVVHGQYLANGQLYDKVALSTSTSSSGPFVGATNRSAIETITFEPGVRLPADMSRMFQESPNLRSVSGIAQLDTSHVTNMEGSFWQCPKLESISDMGDWDTSGLTHAINMFYGCGKLADVGDLAHWDVSNLQSASCMFYGCASLTSVGNLGSWNTEKLTDTYFMFGGSGIQELDLTGWNFDKVTSMDYMLYTGSLKTVYVGSEAIKERLESGAGAHDDCQIIVVGIFINGPSTINVGESATFTITKNLPGHEAHRVHWEWSAGGTEAGGETEQIDFPAIDKVCNGVITAQCECGVGYIEHQFSVAIDWQTMVVPAELVLDRPEINITSGEEEYRVTAKLTDIRAAGYIESAEELWASFEYDTNFEDCDFLTTAQQQAFAQIRVETEYDAWWASRSSLTQKIGSKMLKKFLFEPKSNDLFRIEIIDGSLGWGREDRLAFLAITFKIVWVGSSPGTASYNVTFENTNYTTTGTIYSSYGAPAAKNSLQLSVVEENKAPSQEVSPELPPIPDPEPGPPPVEEPEPTEPKQPEETEAPDEPVSDTFIQYELTISGPTELEVGGEVILDIAKTPEDDEAIVWCSSDEAIAMVNDSGAVTGVAEGEVTISAQAGETVCQWYMTVKPAILDVEEQWEYEVEGDQLTLTRYVGEDTDVIIASQYKVGDEVYDQVSLGDTSYDEEAEAWVGPLAGAANREEITSITYESGVLLPEDTEHLYEGCESLTDIIIPELDDESETLAEAATDGFRLNLLTEDGVAWKKTETGELEPIVIESE